MNKTISEHVDVALIGAGIMSATLGTLLKELEPNLKVAMFERLNDCGQESSNSWNNAGTGHAANCELNYTPPNPDGTVNISKALEVNTEFDLSRQLWSYLVTKGKIADPRDFIHACPHMSFVWGADNVKFLHQRYRQMSANHCYENMQYSEDKQQIEDWAPLIMEGRDPNQQLAVTRVATGTDVDYGALTHLLVKQLSQQDNFELHYKHDVIDIKRNETGGWNIEVKDLTTHDKYTSLQLNMYLLVPVDALSIYSKNQVFQKVKATVVSLLVVFGYVVMKIKSALAIMPKFMEKQM